MAKQRRKLNQAQVSEIRSLLENGFSGSQIAKKVHARKSDVLSEIRNIRGTQKQRSKITVKGKGSQARLRKAKQDNNHKKAVRKVKEYVRPTARFYAIITSLGKFNYGTFNQRETKTLTPAIFDLGDLEKIDHKMYELIEDGKEPIIDYVDLKSERKVSREYVEKRLEK